MGQVKTSILIEYGFTMNGDQIEPSDKGVAAGGTNLAEFKRPSALYQYPELLFAVCRTDSSTNKSSTFVRSSSS